jgi:beta-xylosidase
VVNPQESDEFNEPRLGLQWQWHANYEQAFGMPTSLGCFRLYTWKSDRTLWHTPNLLLQKTPADNFTATTKLKLISKDQNQYGGIIVMGLDYSALVVKRVGEKFELQQITCNNADKGAAERVKTLATLPRTGQDDNDYQFAIHEEIYLRMTVASGKATFAYSTNGKSFKTVGDTFTLREGKWIGAKIGLVAQEPAGKTNRGWIDVDWFKVTR